MHSLNKTSEDNPQRPDRWQSNAAVSPIGPSLSHWCIVGKLWFCLNFLIFYNRSFIAQPKQEPTERSVHLFYHIADLKINCRHEIIHYSEWIWLTGKSLVRSRNVVLTLNTNISFPTTDEDVNMNIWLLFLRSTDCNRGSFWKMINLCLRCK